MTVSLPRLVDAEIHAGDVVFVRIDCNVPLSSEGAITDAFRLEAVTPTFELLKARGARVVIAGALGRPKGKRDESLTTQCIAQYFTGRVFDTCTYVDEAFGGTVAAAIAACTPGNAVMLENLRFWPEEESNDDGFAQSLASLAVVYVNDAFGQCHRTQASIVAITKYLPSYAGICL
ncbi:MAG TPA: phosphoglycerate kinase, partial [Acidimicrobiia bacterium]|nr:phosphoglycerate kinase [Acidimicrobiia bacterium]